MESATHPARWKLLGPLLPALFFWAVMVGVTSTSSAPGGFERTWAQGLKRAILFWTIWALLTPLIIKVDQWLPVAREAMFKRFVLHIPLSLLFTTVSQLLFYVVISVSSGPEQSRLPLDALRTSLKGVFQSNVLGYWIIMSIYLAFDYQKHLKEREFRAAELERLVSESRLHTLRAQLNPHFLFNALN